MIIEKRTVFVPDGNEKVFFSEKRTDFSQRASKTMIYKKRTDFVPVSPKNNYFYKKN